MKDLRHRASVLAAGAAFASALAGPAAPAERAAGQGPDQKPTIVLVHGAFADGSAWQDVIPILQRAGHPTIAVQNPLQSFAEDVATTRRVLEAQKGPVVAVGHSYGGAVITAAASGNANVSALVYVAAFAPDDGEKLGDLYDKFGKAPLAGALVPAAGEFLYIDPARFHEVFARDVPPARAAVMAATQKPAASAIFAGSVEKAAWKTIPSWYLVAVDDQAILVQLQRFMAQRIGARVTEVKASHVPFASRPREVAKIIQEAAAAGGRRQD